ncbi:MULTISPECIES: glycine betaine ABC transporter substrate-binding protein [unclassified Microbacterium]|uniref:glycine betaine ABC transporter substrate-binding protein n=1 Tax=unclassified Microbacterium TaxID=2609290 RepID=UPI0006F3A2A7|nr:MULTISPECIES: glycine betaine ABC transporter substrate-binding protein [unclassified Microbacterium]AOX45825.1 glycine/betaine ABC transporter substrate-binding protein [Microbacterium sp. BH-3-3-3]KQR88474.1 glycine/betaine ABC transporter substrate-binding protein [Microbacterium sp. Leaf179]KQT75158.1 glycine/betaine ABC transporter substrate-binding protein [Microbacterium sp. Leaf436]MBD8217321.1 glycine betaine ABC transporter substrate-binding protein [Microbacterium sp. CFBP 13617]
MNKRHLTTTLALGAVSALALAGCASGNQAEGGDGGGGDKGTITLGFLPSWTDGLSTAYLLEDQLEKLGYTVEMQTLTEAGPLYAGLAQGDVDIYPSAWPELTHADYMNTYGDKIEDLGAYYDNAKLTIAVPSYVDIDSIEQLQANADRFEGRIYGIEPGAGLTKQTQETMLPGYGLDGDFELVTSSTAAMLTELDNAIAAQKDIAVTLWRPFWANDAYDVKDLEDPQGLMGDPEALHFLATSGFAEKYPDAAELIAGIQLDDEQYGSLEDLVVNEYGEGKEPEAVQAWLEQYPDAFPTQRD